MLINEFIKWFFSSPVVQTAIFGSLVTAVALFGLLQVTR